MKKLSQKIGVFCVGMLISLHSISQFKTSKTTWQLVNESIIPSSGARYIVPSKYLTFKLDVVEMQNVLSNAKRLDESTSAAVYVDIPKPDGNFGHYRVMENETMSKSLAQAFPNIRSYDGISEDGSGESVKFDFTPHGFHAMIMRPGLPTLYVDPYAHLSGNLAYYTVYSRADFIAEKGWFCSNETEVLTELQEDNLVTTKSYGNCTKRTYRLALSATGEYTAFHGGTVALAQAAQVTTMNRVNGVFMRDCAVTMTIIANNNLIIYTNTGTDPFTNGDPGSMINQNQTNTTTVIGGANYDVGHVFGTNSGGLAGLGVVCSAGNKARGVTGSSAPIGDPFDIDYVAHELGHQFAGNHTFRGGTGSCNGNANNATSMEPGSGSSIMAYAGICNPQNVQANSDDHFHAISMQEIHTFLGAGANTCSVNTVIPGQSSPTISITNSALTIPANTPFALTATATDPDGDVLTYCWEQVDAGTGSTPQPPLGTNTNGPNFRSRTPQNQGTRYFPSVESLMTAGPFTWEVLPTVNRTMNFRCLVRDNEIGGGCNDFGNVAYTVTSAAGPFVVNYPTASGISVSGLSSMNVTWSVNNTDVAPVSCATVDILISTNNGISFTVIGNDVPNDGSETVTIPNTATTQAIIMVQCANGSFFDVSNNVFAIIAATNTFSLNLAANSFSACQGNNATYTVNVQQIGSFSTPVNLSAPGLPAGTTVNFSPNPCVPGNSSILTITTTGATPVGSYPFNISGTGGAVTQLTPATLVVSNASILTSNLTLPVNLEPAAPVATQFNWNNSGAGILYTIEIASDNTFSTIIESATGLTLTSYTAALLSPSTSYFWRIKTYNACAPEVISTVFSFTTSSCGLYTSTNVPVVISASGTPTVTSTLIISDFGTIDDINVLDLIGTHSYISDLSIRLTSPAGTVVNLMTNPCADEQNWDLAYDDAAASAVLPCPPTSGLSYIPVQPLSVFNGEQMNGTWTLTVIDAFNQDGGSLTSWKLNICYTPTATCLIPDLPTVSGINPLCVGETASLTVASGNLNDATDWKWYTGSCGGTLVNTGASYSSVPAGTYYVRGEGGCVTPGICQTVIITTTSINTNVVTSGTTLTSSQAGATYQWLTCPDLSPIAGEVDQSFVAISNGQYAVQITRNGCVETSACFNIGGIGLEENALNASVFPNPSSGLFKIEFPSNAEIKRLVVQDVTGRIVKLIENTNASTFELDLRNEAKGIYFVRIQAGEAKQTVRIIKQ